MKIVFIQQDQFLRSARRTNPFFDPIIEVCQKNGIDWELYLPSVRVETGYPKDHIRDYHRFSFLSKWFWRIVHVLMPWLPVSRVHWLHGFFARPFCHEWRDADLVITIAHTYSNELAAMRPKRRVVDVQHGIIYSYHAGYFSAQGSLRKELQRYLNFEFWLYGPGYANCFFKNPENHRWLEGRVRVVGDVVRPWTVAEPETVAVNPSAKRHLIVLANQMTPDDDAESGLALKRVYERWLDEMAGVVAAHPDVAVVLRNHPRFGDVVDLSDWKVRYPWLGADQRPFSEVFPESICCVTINSTTVFDAVPYGCPSVLIDGKDVGWANILVDEYDYPYGRLTVEDLLEMSPSAVDQMRERIRKWYNLYYMPFNEEVCLRLLRGDG